MSKYVEAALLKQADPKGLSKQQQAAAAQHIKLDPSYSLCGPDAPSTKARWFKWSDQLSLRWLAVYKEEMDAHCP